MSRRLPTTLLLLALAGATPASASADEDQDLERIPSELRAEPAAPAPAAPMDEDQVLDRIPAEIREAPAPPSVGPPPPRHWRAKAFAEDAFSLASPSRSVPVPYPLPLGRWQNRTSFDLQAEWSPWRPLTLTLSDRLNLIEQDQVALLSRHTLRNDWREGYLAWEIATNTFLEVGRINLRHGVALGWNPTDFWKTRTLVGQPSQDPSAIRQNRLGTLLVRAQTIWSTGSASLAFAPKLYDPSRIVDDSRVGLDPRLDATNAAYRVLGTVGLDLGNLSPQLLGYYERNPQLPGSSERNRARLGGNLSRTFGDAVVAYAEWAGGWEANLIARSFAYGQATEGLAARPPLLLPTDPSAARRSDAAAGASWTIARTLTFNLEYHFHQGGFTRQDWQNWFDLGTFPVDSSIVAAQHWYVRGYANDQQEPVSRHQLFVRASWPRAWGSQLELGGFAFVELYHGSTLAQLTASYYLSHRFTLAAYAAVNAGPARSERGSLPQWGSVVLQIVAYL